MTYINTYITHKSIHSYNLTYMYAYIVHTYMNNVYTHTNVICACIHTFLSDFACVKMFIIIHTYIAEEVVRYVT